MEIVKNREIRRTLYKDEWWYVVEDVVHSLIETGDTSQYIQRMKQRDPELLKGWDYIVYTLPIETTDGFQEMQCANLEGVFRIIQSIPAPKPEPYKQWLAKIGHERIQEFLDPESVSEHRYAAATQRGDRASESSDTSGPTTNLECIFNLLSEAATTEIARKQDGEGSNVNKATVRIGERIVEKVRTKLEKETRSRISISGNCSD